MLYCCGILLFLPYWRVPHSFDTLHSSCRTNCGSTDFRICVALQSLRHHKRTNYVQCSVDLLISFHLNLKSCFFVCACTFNIDCVIGVVINFKTLLFSVGKQWLHTKTSHMYFQTWWAIYYVYIHCQNSSNWLYMYSAFFQEPHFEQFKQRTTNHMDKMCTHLFILNTVWWK